MTANPPAPLSDDATVSLLPIDWNGRVIEIEYRWSGVDAGANADVIANANANTLPDAPVLVFLHEGLGSVAQWKTFPDTLCRRLGMRGLVFSRFGYGASTPRPPAERFPVHFLHREAFEVLPKILEQLGIERPWLIGHSDGGSIALLHAARHSDQLRGIVVMAPHIFVEDVAITSIRAAREAFLHTSLREKLARFHADVDSAFWGWNDVWLDPAFRAFDIEAECAAIRCPILALQGEGDEYGTLEQIRGIARLNPRTELMILPQCGHAPQRDQPEMLIEGVSRFIMRSR